MPIGAPMAWRGDHGPRKPEGRAPCLVHGRVPRVAAGFAPMIFLITSLIDGVRGFGIDPILPLIAPAARPA